MESGHVDLHPDDLRRAAQRVMHPGRPGRRSARSGSSVVGDAERWACPPHPNCPPPFGAAKQQGEGRRKTDRPEAIARSIIRHSDRRGRSSPNHRTAEWSSCITTFIWFSATSAKRRAPDSTTARLTRRAPLQAQDHSGLWRRVPRGANSYGD